MGNKFSLLRIWRIASIEYYKWIINPRMCIVVAMIVFLFSFAVTPLIELSCEMNSPLNLFEPFLAVFNSRVLCLVTPAIYVFLISDYPHLDKNSIFVLYRVTKHEWLLGQFVFFFFSSLSFMLFVLICTTLPNITNSFTSNGWSLVVTRYSNYYPEKASSFSATLITKELYNQITPYHATFAAFMLNLLYMILLSNILLIFHVFNMRKLGIPTTISIIAIGSAIGVFKSKGMWFFPMAHTMVGHHYTEYMKTPIMNLTNSYYYFIIIIIVLLVIVTLKVKDTDFINIDINE
jgi:hypothetical protein